MTEIVNVLMATQNATNEAHRQIQAQLDAFSQNPEFSLYLVYTLAKLKGQVGDEVRQVAGLLLKNNIKTSWDSLPADKQAYIRSEAISAIGEPIPFMRNTVGSIVTTLVDLTPTVALPEIIGPLSQALGNQDQNVVAGSLAALNKICEDSAQKLDTDEAGRPLNMLIPQFLEFMKHPNPNFRRHAIECINSVLPTLPHALLVSMDSYMQGLSQLAADADAGVRRGVCQAIVGVVEIKPDAVLPHIQQVSEFMLRATQDADEDVALQATEFWSVLCDVEPDDAPHIYPCLEALLPQLIPILMNGMKYSQEDIEVFEIEEQEQHESVVDRAESIKPIFHKNKQPAPGEDDDDDDDSEVAQWNLRKCSAAGLDVLSTSFGDKILPHLLPALQARLADQGHWSIRESGILALGAIAEGCYMGLQTHLPQLFPYLLTLCADQAPLIRSISCWTLSRYASWVVELVEIADGEGGDEAAAAETAKYLQPLTERLLERILDHNKKVQEAACSAFATLEEHATTYLVPFLLPILQNLMFAFQKYQAKNLLILYDAVGTLAESIGPDLNTPEANAVLMPPLIAKWNELADTDRQLFPLLECLTSVAQALGEGFTPYAAPVYARCVKIIEATIVSNAARDHALEAQAAQFGSEQGGVQAALQARYGAAGAAQANAALPEAVDKEFIVCSLDLLSGIAEALGPQMDGLVGGSNLMGLVVECLKDQRADVRQSAFALIGDLAKACAGQLAPALQHIMHPAVAALDHQYVSVCNNASWAIGEMAVKIGEPIKPYAAEVVQRLEPIINPPLDEHGNRRWVPNRTLEENACITTGRLGFVCPDVVAPMLNSRFGELWYGVIPHIRDPTEKEHTCKGLCMMLKALPSLCAVPGPLNSLGYSLLSWQGYDGEQPPAELVQLCKEVVALYQQSHGAGFAQFCGQLPHDVQGALYQLQ
jgi:transportin-1